MGLVVPVSDGQTTLKQVKYLYLNILMIPLLFSMQEISVIARGMINDHE